MADRQQNIRVAMDIISQDLSTRPATACRRSARSSPTASTASGPMGSGGTRPDELEIFSAAE